MADYNAIIQQVADASLANSALSQQWAREQMAWQETQNAKAMSFNASEAEKTRQWQQMLSDTAHQREVKDLIAAGLNPVLSAGANGASTPAGASAQGVTSSGAKGTVDTSLASALSTYLSSTINSATQLNMEQMRINQERWMAEKYPSNGFGVIMSLLNQFTNNDPVGSAKNILTDWKQYIKDDGSFNLSKFFTDYFGVYAHETGFRDSDPKRVASKSIGETPYGRRYNLATYNYNKNK